MAFRTRAGSPLNTLLFVFNVGALVFLFGFHFPHASTQHEVQVQVVHEHQQSPPPPLSQTLPYAFCDECGPDDELCVQYGAHNLARSRAYEGSNARLKRVLRDAQRGRPVTIAVLGGSVTNGHGVTPSETWVHHFTAWWNATFPASAMTLQNGAVPATGSDYFSMCFHQHISRHPDLVLTELAVNDQRIESNTEAFEWLMRALLELETRPAIVNLGVFGLAYPLLSTGGDLHLPVSQYYDVPHISLRNVALPPLLHDAAQDRHWFAINKEDMVDHRHIGKNGHRALADLLVAYMQRQLCTLDRHSASPADEHLPRWKEMEDVPRLRMMEPWDAEKTHEPLQPYCASTRTLKHPLVPIANEGWANWTYRGNRVKPYVRSTLPGSRVSFRVVVHSMGRVRLTYLKSADFDLGSVKCWVDDDESRGVKITGKWDYKGLNIAHVYVIARNVPPGEHTLSCELLDHEFRVIAVDAA
ncbi:hypothetical protein AURDEDRAFT_186962 [Auricularia subglabra TFB-10046 SS5]|nr:hypothetical protein AURDEDRAFT_186962 [Auricularia subglabra TFB-10046 SS5]